MSEGCLIYGAMQRALKYTNKPWIRQSFFRQCFKVPVRQSFLLPKFFTAKVFTIRYHSFWLHMGRAASYWPHTFLHPRCFCLAYTYHILLLQPHSAVTNAC